MENNGPLLGNRRHFAWLAKNFVPAWREAKVTPSIGRKVHTIIPQVFRWRYPLDCGGRSDFTRLSQAFLAPVEEWLRPFDQRPVDIAFVGVVNEARQTRDVYGVNSHRAKAMKAIEAIHERHPELSIFKVGQRLSYPKFISLLRDTKVFVSPFGLGEFSGKDYEAILAGSLLVKPYAEKIRSYPNIYESSISLNVGIDFEGLEEVILPYLKDPNLARVRAQRGLKTLRDFSAESRFAADLDKAMSQVAARRATFNKTACHKFPAVAYDEFGELGAP